MILASQNKRREGAKRFFTVVLNLFEERNLDFSNPREMKIDQLVGGSAKGVFHEVRENGF